MRFGAAIADAIARAAARLLLVAVCVGAVVGVCVALFASPCHAQRPAWDVWRTTVDQVGPWELRGPRVGIQAVRAVGGAETYRALRALTLPPRWAAPTAAVLSGVAPHVLGLARHAYPFDGADWAADAVIAGGSAYVARAYATHRRRAATTALYVAGWALAAGWAHP